RQPGLYLFDLARREEPGTPGGPSQMEQRAFVFNVDARESDLRRAAKEDLEGIASGVQVRNPGSGWAAELANRQHDLSEWPWFYLIFLLILVAEQALAVHLSFHLKGSEAASPTQAALPRASAA